MTDEDDLIGHPLEKVPTREPDDTCNGRRKQKQDGQIVRDGEDRVLFGGYCQLTSGWGTEIDHGRCRKHGGGSTGPKTEEGKETSSQNALKHGAFCEHFTSSLTEGESEAFEDAYDHLGDPGDAQDVARAAASMCLLQFRRSGDERFLRRFEGLCDKFGIAPADELEVSGSVTLEDAFMRNLKQANGHEVDD
ncbi:uncharacterized protein Nmag_1650 [Natrialba magadii ATCC 43099]|uniref:Uncharacterized protein n=1 Tax=Natrialba magadii (strain ATCC 43099 / DSM 3394 / CCM 3739 / CIP 104546 / IAM 13178 / JCM 8861 / NBRC 102185 / NCIMB 2190 / MS3) TaxID=547559 RepID=D3SUG8_NATMM|nr:hypothetical protein [Natrialba magadii]ADD05226.1 uncharacterized protein Nmag_1650 [Natrialba magadii ATCC 43099]